MTAWNPMDIKDVALPPCHVLAQFYVSGVAGAGEKNKLSCQMYQRSCDLGLGVPFNIASYALLTCVIAQVCGLERGEFIHTLGDMHVYKTHVDQLKEQVKRMPHPFPLLKLDKSIKSLEDFQMWNYRLINYTHDEKITLKLAV